MMSGVLSAIFIAPQTGAPVIEVIEAHLIAGKGIVGDRYFSQVATEQRYCTRTKK